MPDSPATFTLTQGFDACNVGQMNRLTNTVTVSTTLTDPTGFTMDLLSPAGVTTTYTSSQMTHSSTGVWYVDVIPSLEGVYRYLWTSTATAVGASEGQFTVLDTPFD